MIGRWPLHLKPREYEILYQWIERLAEAYGVSFRVFCRVVLGLTPDEIGALKRTLPEKALHILSNGTGVPISDLRERDLYSMFRLVQNDLAKDIATHPEQYEKFLNHWVHKV
jgi:hypothetical protein